MDSPTPEPVFFTAVYGRQYAAFLAPHLASVQACHPGAEGLVLWSDLPRWELAQLSRAFPRWRFEPAPGGIGGSLHERIPRKLHAWAHACGAYPGRPVALLDCDTLVMRPLERFLEGDWDVIFTHKDERFPVNTGVMLVRDGRVGALVMEDLVRRVEAIIAEPGALEEAVQTSGAADQHALRQLIGMGDFYRDIPVEVGGRRVVFRGVPCRELNETNCRPITEDLHIIHYKTGWHPILLRGGPFTVNRPESRCREMFEHWHAHLARTGLEVARAVVMDAADRGAGRMRGVLCPYEERGVLHSEMLAVCAVSGALGAEVVVESGRCRGQSTLMLGRYFRGTPTRVVSIELERDENAEVAEQRLAGQGHVQLLYGDGFGLIPGALADGRPATVLLDGPKGMAAVELAFDLLERFENLAAVFIHDTRRGTPQREALEASGLRVFFTDDQEYVRRFGGLDERCLPGPDAAITEHTWRPWRKGEDAIPSYGPTLAVVLPTPGVRSARPEPAAA